MNGHVHASRVYRFGISAWIAIALAVTALPATSADYPVRPIRWLLGFPPGGTSDTLARAVAEKLTERWGQQIVIDNRPGAGGVIANELAARASPDGYTILLVSSTYANLVAMGTPLRYDPEKDLLPVSLLASASNVLVVHPSLPMRSVREFVEYAKSKPGQLNYGAGGTGTGSHLAAELFKMMTGINVLHIPYKGTPPAVTDLVAGRVQLMFALSPAVLVHVKAARLRALGVSGTSRLAELQEVPTIAETIPGYEATTWYGLLVPARTPKRIVDALNREIGSILATPAIKDRLAPVGFEIRPSTPEEFTQYMRDEIVKWSRVIKHAQIRS